MWPNIRPLFYRPYHMGYYRISHPCVTKHQNRNLRQKYNQNLKRVKLEKLCLTGNHVCSRFRVRHIFQATKNFKSIYHRHYLSHRHLHVTVWYHLVHRTPLFTPKFYQFIKKLVFGQGFGQERFKLNPSKILIWRYHMKTPS